MRRLEDWLAVWGLVRNEGIVGVHTDFFKQFWSAEVCNHKHWDFLHLSVYNELEHALKGYASASYCLEYRRKDNPVSLELGDEALSELAYGVKSLEASVRGVHCGELVPEEFLLAEKVHHALGVSGAEGIYKQHIRAVCLDLSLHILVQPFNAAFFPYREIGNVIRVFFYSGSARLQRQSGKGYQ